MRPLRVWKQLLGLRRTVVEQVEFDDTDEVLVMFVRPRAASRVAARIAGGGARATIRVRVAGGGGR